MRQPVLLRNLESTMNCAPQQWTSHQRVGAVFASEFSSRRGSAPRAWLRGVPRP